VDWHLAVANDLSFDAMLVFDAPLCCSCRVTAEERPNRETVRGVAGLVIFFVVVAFLYCIIWYVVSW
jgi:hypothetical protein